MKWTYPYRWNMQRSVRVLNTIHPTSSNASLPLKSLNKLIYSGKLYGFIDSLYMCVCVWVIHMLKWLKILFDQSTWFIHHTVYVRLQTDTCPPTHTRALIRTYRRVRRDWLKELRARLSFDIYSFVYKLCEWMIMNGFNIECAHGRATKQRFCKLEAIHIHIILSILTP